MIQTKRLKYLFQTQSQFSLFYARSLESKTSSQRFYLPLNLSIHLICPSTILTLLLYVPPLCVSETTISWYHRFYYTCFLEEKTGKKGQENFSYTFLSNLKFEMSARNCARRFVKSSRKVGFWKKKLQVILKSFT